LSRENLPDTSDTANYSAAYDAVSKSKTLTDVLKNNVPRIADDFPKQALEWLLEDQINSAAGSQGGPPATEKAAQITVSYLDQAGRVLCCGHDLNDNNKNRTPGRATKMK
jgi:hypothetical protein